jgi:hypothetical protein
MGLHAATAASDQQAELTVALLAEAGYPDGFDTSLRVLADQPFLNIAIAIQS